MSEVLFYHLTASRVERTLPQVLGMSLERGWRVVIRVGSRPALERLDEAIWTFDRSAFLPHGVSPGKNSARQPICLTLETGNPNQAEVLMLVEGARARPEEMAGFTRTCLFFDGSDPAAVDAARGDWRAVVAAGHTAVYWAQDDERWVKKATS